MCNETYLIFIFSYFLIAKTMRITDTFTRNMQMMNDFSSKNDVTNIFTNIL